MSIKNEAMEGQDIKIGDEVDYLGKWRKVTNISPSAVDRMMMVNFEGSKGIVYLPSFGVHSIRRHQTAADLPVGTILKRNWDHHPYHMVKVGENDWTQITTSGDYFASKDNDLDMDHFEDVTHVR